MAKTSHPGVYRRGSRWVAVYRIDGRQHKESARTFQEAREIKIRRAAQAACDAAGPTLHGYALEWVDQYAGRGANDVINDRTRREYRRLLIKYALAYATSRPTSDWARLTSGALVRSSTGCAV
jgi:hypothetical protein